MSDEFRARKRMPRFTQCSPYVAASCHISGWLAEGPLRLKKSGDLRVETGENWRGLIVPLARHADTYWHERYLCLQQMPFDL